MLKQFLTSILTTAILGISPIFAMEQKIPDESRDTLTTSQRFDFAQGNQEALDKWVAHNGAEIYRHLNNHPKFAYPEDTKKPVFYTRSQYWTKFCIYGDNQVDFIKETNIPASTAIKSLLDSEGRFDCRIAQRIVFLECMRRLMGDTSFDECNKQFEAELSQRVSAGKGETRILHLCGSPSLNPYFRLTSRKRNSLYYYSHSKFLDYNAIGYFGYIKNVNEYAILHPHGLLRGDHGLLCSGAGKNEKLYIGYGSFYKDGGLCWDDVIKCFKNETLTVSLPEKAVIDEDKKAGSKDWPRYVEGIEKFHESTLRAHKSYIESSLNTGKYEKDFEDCQMSLWEDSALYFIDFEKVDQFLRKVNTTNIVELI